MHELDGFSNSPPVNIRSIVIDKSVKIEYLIDTIVSASLGLGFKDSLSFGNRSSSLSFLNKINLLIDFNFITEKAMKSKFQCFAEIRNQFAHVLEVDSMSKCRQENLKMLRKFYAAAEPISEIDYEKLYFNLYEDVKKMSFGLIEVSTDRIRKRAAPLAKLKVYEAVNKRLREESENNPEFNLIFKRVVEETLKEYWKNQGMIESENLPFI